ncbi:putative secreted protein (Por secretion system target) [Nonlabens xylanidelens]|uniref:Putative secreted protein (Por secretion system target) n=1 Tax=Nonlabens xylanidelens TaxID=191564 RepID=A0A2S6IJB0_9FLAO|nr:zinc-dependent metalloprotease family protein [Nonlabens xylanidelens]PPK94307.1 putative secreted protein (Por secretion system target) [Nonlabens xylanidelens]PQJ18840.1 hypothetical protein BST94_07440 [Nonlabens xylanidelens]
MNKILFFAFLILLPFSTYSQTIWKSPDMSIVGKISKDLRPIQPNKFDIFDIDVDALSTKLDGAVDRFDGGTAIEVDFPLGNDQFETFSIYTSGAVSEELHAQYPQIQSYVGQSKTNLLNKIYFTITPKGFHGLITGEKILYMDPYSKVSPESIMIYNRKDLNRASDDNFACQVDDSLDALSKSSVAVAQTKSFRDLTFRTYRIAIAATAEYTAYHDDGNIANGNAVSDALSGIVVTLTRVNSVYEQEMSMRFSLVGNNNNVIYTDPSTDPYSNYSGSDMLAENTNTLTSVLGTGSYDIGHVFSTGGGGIAGTSPCSTGKERGVTGIVTPEFDPFDIDYVCHEIGHQFGASHTYYNPCFGSAGGQPFETGSASTIMGYAGICSPNVQENSDAYFHAASIQQMHNSIDADTCEVEVNLTNDNPTAPISNDLAEKFLPISTPFKLTGNSGQVPDSGEVYTYNWEQWDEGTSANAGSTQPPVSTNTTGPMFRTKFATTSPTRYFPNLEEVLNGTDDTWETLNSVSRDMRFVCTIRDNNLFGGQTDRGEVIVKPRDVVGPFVVNTPLLNEIWHEGEMQTVTWDVAGTNRVELATEVNIKLSLDGGYTYPVTLASNVSNTGSSSVVIPTGTKTANARIMVEAVDNYFFNVNNGNFEIKEGTFELTAVTKDFSVCQPGNGTTSFQYNAAPGFNETVTFSAVGLPAGLIASFNPNTTTVDATVDIVISGTSSVEASQYDFTVEAQSSTATIVKDFTFKLFDNSIGDVLQVAPVNGAGNQVANPLLEWEDLASAANYFVEISENPSFSTIAESGMVSFVNSYQPTVLEAGKIYYWKVTPSSDCVAGTINSISSFQTAQDVCRTYENEYFENGDNVWENSAVNAVSARMSIPDDIEITQVSYYMRASHSDTGDIKMQFSAPSGRFSEVYNRECADGANFDLTVSDNGTQNFSCASTYRGALTGNQRPGQAFTRFNGLSAQGEWVLLATDRVGTVRDRFGNITTQDGGTFNEFSVTVCGRLQYVNDIDNNRNLGLTTAFNATSIIDNTLLRSVQTGFTNANLVYVVTNDVDYGQIQLNGVDLNVGDSFSQGDLNNSNIQYVHDSMELVNEDSFGYTVLGNSDTVLLGDVFTITIEDPTLIYDAGAWSPFAPHAETGGLNAQVLSGVAPIAVSSVINNMDVMGAMSTLDINATLAVKGNLTVDGLVDATDGVLEISGASSQTVTGTGSLDLDILEVNNTAGVTFDAVTNIYNVLKPQSSVINANNNIVFKSNATTTGQLDNASLATINGSVKVERYIPAKRAFRFLSSSVNSTGSIRENWQEDGNVATGLGTHITGPSAANGFDVTSTGAYSLFTFDNDNYLWNAVPNTNIEQLVIGTPIRMLVRGDRNTDLTNNAATPSNTTLRSSGVLHTGDYSASYATSNGEFAMIANPYQAVVDFKSVLLDAATTGMNANFVYVWDPNLNVRGGYATVDLGTANGDAIPMSSTANKFLQPGQSLFVSTSGASTLTFKESQKAVSQPLTQVFGIYDLDNEIIIGLKDAATRTVLDQAVMRFNNSYNDQVDNSDALKFNNLDETLAISNGVDILSVEKTQHPQAGDVTPLHISNYRINNYVMELDLNLNSGVTATLVDNEIGTRTILQNGVNVVNFNVSAAGSSSNRFKIEYGAAILSLEQSLLENDLEVFPNPVVGNSFQVNSSYLSGKEVTMTLYNTLGQRIYTHTNEFNGSQTIKPSTVLSAGMYILKVETDVDAAAVQLIVK